MASIDKSFGLSKGLEVGEDALYVDGENSKTGIGKTLPQYGLDVASTANFDGIVAAGQVGIGSTQPQRDLDITTDMKLGGRLYAHDNNPGSEGKFLESTGTGVIWSNPSSPEEFNVIFVTEDGDDNNSGKTIDRAKRTVAAACTMAVAGNIIRITAGVYPEDNPVSVPRNVTIDGDDLRNTQIIPKNIGKDMFQVDNGVLIQNLSFVGAANTGAMIAYHEPRTNTHTFIRDNGEHKFNRATSVITDNLAVTHGISTATYEPLTGELVLTTEFNHGLTDSNSINIVTGSLYFSCSSNNFASEIGYPRATDPIAGVSTNILAYTDNTLTVNIGQVRSAGGIKVGSFTGTGLTATAADFNPRTGIMTVSASNGLSSPSTHSMTTAVYDPSSGIMTVTAPAHGFNGSDHIKFDTNSLIFKCSSDGFASTIAHPRPGEPSYNQFLGLKNVTANEFEVNVGSTSNGNYVHRLEKVEANNIQKAESYVGFVTSSLTFTCMSDNNNTQYKHPRPTEPLAGVLTAVYDANADYLMVNVQNAGIGSDYVGFITQSPYIRNCTNFVPDSLGMRIDGDKAANLKSMVVDSYTQYNQGGIGVSITNDGYAQLVSIFTVCDKIGIFCGSGGQCDLTNSNSSFGDEGLVALGIGTVNYTGILTATAQEEDNTFIVSNLGNERPYTGQVFYVGELFQTVDEVTVTSAGFGYTNARPPRVTFANPSGDNGIAAEGVANISGFGSVTSVSLIASGTQYRLTDDLDVTIEAPPSGITATATASFRPLYYTINSATTPTAGVSTITVDQTIPANIGAGATVPFARQSLILASSHSFEYIGTGVTITTALPRLGGVTIPENQTVSKEGGKVVHTSTDERGNFLIGDEFTINQQTGTITGDAFNKSIQATLTPLIISLGA